MGKATILMLSRQILPSRLNAGGVYSSAFLPVVTFFGLLPLALLHISREGQIPIVYRDLHKDIPGYVFAYTISSTEFSEY